MRHWFVIALAALVTLGTPADAEAGKKKKKKDDTEESASEGIEIIETGLDEVDSFFEKAKAPIDTITNTRVGLDKVNADLNTALGLPEGTPFADAVADLKGKADGKISVAMEGSLPKLEAEDGVPENVQTAVDAVNSGFGELTDLVAGLQELPNQFAELIAEGKKFSDPATIKGMASNPLAAGKAIPKVGKNLKSLTEAKGEAEELVSSIDSIKKSFTTLDD